MKKFFVPFQLKRYVEESGEWSDGEGEWVDLGLIDGHIRTLGSNEYSSSPDIRTTHRFYTEYDDLLNGDKLVYNGKEYATRLIDHKQIKTSAMDFYQVDCEGIQ